MNDTDINIYPEDNFFSAYFRYIGYPHNTEASLTVHRWCAISVLGAMLGRQFVFPFGDGELLPNSFIQIIGVPATRKSTAIKQSKKLLKRYGYGSFAPEKISLEKFLMELHELTWGTENGETDTSPEQSFESSIFGSDNPKEAAELLDIAEMYIASDEFVDFIGRNNVDFISLLGTLWDYAGVYDRKLKHSKAVYINNPTINIIAGNTHEGFNQAFPPDIQGQGFFSRLLLIHAEPTGRKITIPKAPSNEDVEAIVAMMHKIKSTCIGAAKHTEQAEQLVEKLYHSWKPLEDTRFEHYSGRRLTHLLKLSLVCAAARLSREIHSCDVLMANTLLTFAEYQMPKAMGHFGKGRNSAITHKILAAINAADEPVTMAEIMKLIHTDVDKLSDVPNLVAELQATNKIQGVKTAKGNGFLAVHAARAIADTALIKPSWLAAEETKLS
jgi:hypothetical protein